MEYGLILGQSLVAFRLAWIFDFHQGGESLTSDDKIRKTSSDTRRDVYAPANCSKVIDNGLLVSIGAGGMSHFFGFVHRTTVLKLTLVFSAILV